MIALLLPFQIESFFKKSCSKPSFSSTVLRTLLTVRSSRLPLSKICCTDLRKTFSRFALNDGDFGDDDLDISSSVENKYWECVAGSGR